MLWGIKYEDIKKLEAFIELKASKLKDCRSVVCHVKKNYFKTKFSKRKQSFRGVLLKSIFKLLVNSLKNICEWIHFQRSCRLSVCNFTKGKLQELVLGSFFFISSLDLTTTLTKLLHIILCFSDTPLDSWFRFSF